MFGIAHGEKITIGKLHDALALLGSEDDSIVIYTDVMALDGFYDQGFVLNAHSARKLMLMALLS